MTPIEILALIVAVMGAVKLVFVFVKPAAWMGVVKKVYGKPVYTMGAAIILGVIILTFLLEELTIVDIFAVMSFIMVLMMLGVAALGDEVIALSDKVLQNKDMIKKMWLSAVVWAILIIWVLLEIFA